MPLRSWTIVALVLVAGACNAASPAAERPTPTVAPRIGPMTPTDPDRLPVAEAAAIVSLAQGANNNPPVGGHGHSHGGPESETELSPFERREFDAQVAQAVAAVPSLDTTEEAAAAGYVLAAAPGPGVGTHWVKWSLIDEPFDPARPAMLLFHDRPNGPSKLAGFSYWLHDAQMPEGFAGANDHWHQHTGLCIVNGWVDREMATECAGVYFGGSDLWMLHAWIVPGWDNRWGRFATMNPRLCPPVTGTPEMLRCPDDAAGL